MNDYFVPAPEQYSSEESYFPETETPSTDHVIEDEFISEEQFKDYARSLTRTIIEKYDIG